MCHHWKCGESWESPTGIGTDSFPVRFTLIWLSFLLAGQQVWSGHFHFAWHVSGQIGILFKEKKKAIRKGFDCKIRKTNSQYS